MIGVIARAAEKWAVHEFFELFKTPWEFCRPGRSYRVVVATCEARPPDGVELVVRYGAAEPASDRAPASARAARPLLLRYRGLTFPVYTPVRSFESPRPPQVTDGESGRSVAELTEEGGVKKIRVGYNLFAEMHHLLTAGQPATLAEYPTVEIQIAILRDWILRAGIPLVEIPPRPEGREFTVCLSHDVDFVRLSRHRLDRTMFGFLYRATIYGLKSFLKRRRSLGTTVKGWVAALLLPGVYLGVVRDYFHQFDRYLEIEKGLASTFFFLPFKNTPGVDAEGRVNPARASKYDVDDIRPELQQLRAAGCEIGLHGIDAWRDDEMARRELARIREIVGDRPVGVRMHWLYDSADAIARLEAAGFRYDSTRGYNDAIGYRNGTTQAFRPPEGEAILEIPLNVMDSALFYPSRMDVSEEEAGRRIDRLIAATRRFGGVLMINWHQRSLGPERFWRTFYVRLIESLKSLNVWFATAGEVAEWYARRRSVRFDRVEVRGGALDLEVSVGSSPADPPLVVRVSVPAQGLAADGGETRVETRDFALRGSLSATVPLSFHRASEHHHE